MGSLTHDVYRPGTLTPEAMASLEMHWFPADNLSGICSFSPPPLTDHQPDGAGELDHGHPLRLRSRRRKTPPQGRHAPAPQVRNQKTGTED